MIDSERISRDVSRTGHWGNGDYELIISNDNDIDYVKMLVKKSYERKG